MNVRCYRIKLDLSPIDFPAIEGLGEQQEFTQTDSPFIVNNKVRLKITKKFILVETYTNKIYEILTAQSIYEIPIKTIQTREDIYECYKDATLGLSEAYNFGQKQVSLPNISFSTAAIETYFREIDGVFNLLNTLN